MIKNGSPSLRLAVVGLGFGAEFVPLYLAHPDVGDVVLVEPDEARRSAVAARYGLARGHGDLDDALASGGFDAVHLLTPVPTHAALTLRCLEAGLHVACAVPMATTSADLDLIIFAAESRGLVYQMMETSVFSREFRFVRSLHQRGSLGRLTLYSGSHVQNLDGFPTYWQGYPPMHYSTHALSPALALLDTEAAAVTAHGSGVLDEGRRTGGYDNRFPAEVALFTLRDSAVLAQVTMAFFQTGRSYYEGFSVYGDRGGVEWPADNCGPLTVYGMTSPEPGSRGNAVHSTAVEPPDHPDDLPEPLRRFVAGGGHGGSHPYLVDAFVGAILGRRPSPIGARVAAGWTAPGIAAHASALAGGTRIDVPAFRHDTTDVSADR